MNFFSDIKKSKLVPLIASLVLTLSVIPGVYAQTPPLSGDINGDGVIDNRDVDLCANVYLGTETDPDTVTRCDVNGDGAVDVLDVQLIVNACSLPDCAQPKATPTPSPPPGCYYEQVECIQAPCPPILICSSPSPSQVQGDINGDGVVNILDFQNLSNNFGTNNPDSDLNQDGVVNILDFQVLSNNFGKTGG